MEGIECVRFLFTPALRWKTYIPGGALAESQKRYYQKKREAILSRHKERYANDAEYRATFIARVKASKKRGRESSGAIVLEIPPIQIPPA